MSNHRRSEVLQQPSNRSGANSLTSFKIDLDKVIKGIMTGQGLNSVTQEIPSNPMFLSQNSYPLLITVTLASHFYVSLPPSSENMGTTHQSHRSVVRIN